MSKVAPRCGYCGAAFQEGGLDWEQAEQKARADQVKSNTTTGRLYTPLNFDQRAYALRNLYSADPASAGSMLEKIAEGLIFDYSFDKLKLNESCQCGARADLAANITWSMDFVVGREFNGAHAAALLVGVLAWTEKKVGGSFNTYHPCCSGCAKPLFSSKRAFDKHIEMLPEAFNFRRVDFYIHPALG